MHKWILICGAGLALLSVILGAFAAHGLKNKLDEYSLNVFQTAVQYQMVHGIALILCGLFAMQLKRLSVQGFDVGYLWVNISAISFIVGILLFSGSLYGLALTSQKWLGPITPLGGLLFIFGWIAFIVAATKYS